MKLLKTVLAALLFSSLLSCDKEPDIKSTYLDGDVIFDPSLFEPEKFLVSAKYPNPTAVDLDKHILIAIHGYSASTFEWQEFADWSVNNFGDTGTYRVSQVLLDGHGRDYESFKASKWEHWVDAAAREYEKLVDLGYTKISFVGSSTGGTILLNLIHSGYFNTGLKPKNIFMIDPIVVSSVKVQSIAGIIGPMLVYVETDQTAEENNYWYRFRPEETVNELNDLMKTVQKELERGITAPTNTYVKVFHSEYDPTASSTSAVLMYKGLKLSNGNKIGVEIMVSDIHVFTRLALRSDVTQKQKENQQSAFTQMAMRLN